MKMRSSLLALVTVAAIAQPAFADCWQASAERHGVPVDVLKAIATVESAHNPAAINVNRGGSRDVGIMQINDSWLPTLSKHGVDEVDLWVECTNIDVGAWILAHNIKHLGWNWSAIGAYNVGCRKLSEVECERRRARYAWKVYAALAGTSHKGATQ